VEAGPCVRAHLVGICSLRILRGERQIGLEYVEALLAAVDLEVRRRTEVVQEAR